MTPATKTPTFKTELRTLDTIQPYDRNPRLNDNAVAAVAESLRQFGFRQPIVIDPAGVIICGHTRWKAAQELGLTKVPVHIATDLTDEQIRAYRIADNKTGELAEWDFEILPIEIEELQGGEMDMSDFGFGDKELTQLLDEASGIHQGLTDPDEVPEPPDDPITQLGDVWILGEHRLMCGDSCSETDLDTLLDGAGIDLVNMDPPYNVKVEPRSNNAIAAGLSSFAGSNTTHHQSFDVNRHPEKAKGNTKKMRAKDRPLANDFVTDEAFDVMLAAWFGNASRVLKPD